MSKLVWSEVGKRFFEIGVDRGVFYPKVGPGVAWNGLVSVAESASGGEVEPFYHDGVKYVDVMSAEDFQATLEAYSAPIEFAACDGSKQLVPGLFATQQPRKTFGFSYRTRIGNDIDGLDYAYKLHVVYNATAGPSEIELTTFAPGGSPPTRKWTLYTVPQPSSTYKPTAHFVFDSRYMNPMQLEELESFLYGREDREPRLPSQAEILDILQNQIDEFIGEQI